MRAVSDGAEAIESGHAERAVKFPSDPPPVEASSSVKSQFTHQRLRLAKKFAHGRGAFERRPIDSPAHFDSRAFQDRPQAAQLSLDRWRIGQRVKRISTSARAWAGTTLETVPPATTVACTVIPRRGSFIFISRSICSANSCTAFTPSSGLIPACAARPG